MGVSRGHKNYHPNAVAWYYKPYRHHSLIYQHPFIYVLWADRWVEEEVGWLVSKGSLRMKLKQIARVVSDFRCSEIVCLQMELQSGNGVINAFESHKI